MTSATSTKSKRIDFLGSEVLIGLALGANSAWVHMAFKSITLYGIGNNPVGPSHESVLDATYLVSIVSVCLTFVICALAEKRTWEILAHFPTYLALAIGTAITTFLMPLGDPAGTELQQIIIVIAGVFSGLFSGLFLLYFGIVISQLRLQGKVVTAAVATACSSVLFAGFNLLPPSFALPVASLTPLLAAALLAVGMMEASESGTEEAEESAIIPGFSTAFSCAIVRCKPAPITDAMEQTAWRGLIGRIAAASFLVGFANESVRTLYVQMDLVSAGQYAYAAVEAVDSFIATVLVVALAVLLLLRRTERMAQDCYFAICILLALGILLLPAPALYDGVNSFVPQAINSAAYGAFGMFIWILSACICGSLPRSTITGMATIRAAWALGPLAGIVFGRFVLKTWGPSLEGTYPIMLFALLALIVVATFVFSAEDLGRIMDIVPRKAQQRFRFKCELVAKRYGLTERESEIMMMLAKGRNLPFIQNQLFLSKSTVSTHRQHIYQKTGVHSQQELINLVQEAE